ncbi:hypothetical protein T03_5132 [Trichinella britovi]|uniref:Uncharacterized protein n=1 Tax=Trichinella britovi TaxID=45882 RepID=A0A0V1CSW7_TRIBR|nr:hypothetical protein T03_5132 [Trichinella britovi]KRZ95463.1 hypothetical protein T08_9324 [Trichinella sp. T8]
MTAVCLEAYLHWLAGPQKSKVLGSIVVSIPACHAGDPGSIPGRGSQNIGRIFGSMVLVRREEITATIEKITDYHR